MRKPEREGKETGGLVEAEVRKLRTGALVETGVRKPEPQPEETGSEKTGAGGL